MNNLITHDDPSYSPLGQSSTYVTQYSPELLYAIARKNKRDEIDIPEPLPFYGYDTWNAYEVSWLNPHGKPIVAIAQFDIACSSKNIIESKSFKLYLNSLNNTSFESYHDVEAVLKRDLALTLDGELAVTLYKLDELSGIALEAFKGELIDDYDVVCDTYTPHPDYLSANPHEIVSETLRSDLLKSNCLVTGQPDWGSVRIKYTGPQIDKSRLLQYIVSFRNHNEFHEQCVERIFIDLMNRCQPQHLTVEARYTRRGGLDINPIRSTSVIGPAANIRMVRQ